MTNTDNKKSVKYYLNVAIMLFFYFGFRYIAPFGQVTEIGMQVLGIFIGFVWGCIFIDMLWPSMLALFALGLTDCFDNVVSVVGAGASNKSVILMFFFLVFSQYLESSGLSRTIAFKLLTLKWINGSAWKISFMIIFGAYALGVLINTYAIIFLFWSIIYDICKIAGYGKQEPLSAFLLVGITHCASISGTVMPYQVFPQVCLNALNQATGITVETTKFIAFNLIISFIAMLSYFLACKLLFKIDVAKFNGLTREQLLNGNKIVYDKEQKIATVILVAFLVMILIPTFLPDGNIIKALYNKIGDQGILIGLMAIVCAIQIKNKNLTTMAKLINDGMNWSIMFLFLAIFVLGGALNSDEAGIIPMISSMLTPIFTGLNGIVFLIVAFLLLGAITQVAHNLVMAVVFIPILTKLAISLGLDNSVAIMLAVGLDVVLLQALLTPASSNRGALNYGNDWIGKKYAFKYGATAIITAISTVIIIGIPLGLLMF